MAADHTTLPVLAVLFLATLIRSAFGFGEALVAVPLLALLIPVEVAAPVAALVSITVAAVVVVQEIAVSALSVASGFEVDCRLKLVPFQSSARV